MCTGARGSAGESAEADSIAQHHISPDIFLCDFFLTLPHPPLGRSPVISFFCTYTSFRSLKCKKRVVHRPFRLHACQYKSTPYPPHTVVLHHLRHSPVGATRFVAVNLRKRQWLAVSSETTAHYTSPDSVIVDTERYTRPTHQVSSARSSRFIAYTTSF